MNNIYVIWFLDAVKQEIADQTVEVIDFSTEDENTEIIEQNLSGTDVMRLDSNHMQPQTSAGRVFWIIFISSWVILRNLHFLAMLNFGAMGIPYVPIPRPIRTDNGQLVSLYFLTFEICRRLLFLPFWYFDRIALEPRIRSRLKFQISNLWFLVFRWSRL